MCKIVKYANQKEFVGNVIPDLSLLKIILHANALPIISLRSKVMSAYLLIIVKENIIWKEVQQMNVLMFARLSISEQSYLLVKNV